VNLISSTALSDSFIAESPAMRPVCRAIARAAAHNVTVLIRGEVGTGKEHAARAIHRHSDRSQGPFLTVCCAAIPDALLVSELFGHEKGAFTGADQRRIGKLEQCSGGTLFLDEAGDISMVVQARLDSLSKPRATKAMRPGS
jgi:two-component system nitrogen regulation response regulator GlnG